MKKLLIIFLALLGVAVIIANLRSPSRTSGDRSQRSSGSQSPAGSPPRIPAHYEEAKSLSDLPPTLPPERFFGSARQAYQVAKEIPQTLAQLPCYCYCDESFGHKSLHSCYETDHSSQCAVCVSEALLAYRLQKEQRLSPAQIRERIIAEFSRQ